MYLSYPQFFLDYVLLDPFYPVYTHLFCHLKCILTPCFLLPSGFCRMLFFLTQITTKPYKIHNLSCTYIKNILSSPLFSIDTFLQFIHVSMALICQNQQYCSTCAMYSWIITSLEDNVFASVCSPKIILFSANISPLNGFPLLSLGVGLFFSFLVLCKYLSPAEQLSLWLFFPDVRNRIFQAGTFLLLLFYISKLSTTFPLVNPSSSLQGNILCSLRDMVYLEQKANPETHCDLSWQFVPLWEASVSIYRYMANYFSLHAFSLLLLGMLLLGRLRLGIPLPPLLPHGC